MSIKILHPAGWPRPRGYSYGMAGRGTWVSVAGQIGWDPTHKFTSTRLSGQARQVFQNILRVLSEAGASAQHVVRMTWYVTDLQAYRDQSKEIGVAYREAFGKHFPAMTLVQVTALVEPEALIEIEATALVPD